MNKKLSLIAAALVLVAAGLAGVYAVRRPRAAGVKGPSGESKRKQAWDKIGGIVNRYKASELQDLLEFQKSFPPSNPSKSEKPFISFDLAVELKKDFVGTITFYSCDMSELRLLDRLSGEFIKSVTYEVNGRPGHLLNLGVEYYNDSHPYYGFSMPPVCGEVNRSGEAAGGAQYIRLANKEALDPDGVDYSVKDFFRSISVEYGYDSPPDSFAVMHARRVLSVFPEEKVRAVLAELVKWVSWGSVEKDYLDLIKLALARETSGDFDAAVAKLLESSIPEVRKAGIEVLAASGKNTAVAKEGLKRVFSEERDDSVLAAAVAFGKKLNMDIPVRLLPPDEIPAQTARDHKNRIREVCAAASSVDVSTSAYAGRDAAGAALPVPQKAAAAIAGLEDLVANMPNYPEMAEVYLLLGRLKLKYAEEYSQGLPGGRADLPEQYTHSECSDTYMYNGWHFKRMLKLFPQSALSQRAEFELNNSVPSGGCD